MTFSIYKTRLSPCGDGKLLLLLLFLLLFISERAYWTGCSTIVLKTWNVDNVRNPLVFYNFDIRFPFGVFIPEKKNAPFHQKLQKYSFLQAS